MRWRNIILGLAMSWLGMPSAAWAIIIDIFEPPFMGAPPVKIRVVGYLVSKDDKTLVIRVFKDGKEKEKPYDRAKYKVNIIHEIDKDRLAKLVKDDPKAYRDYAEVLADKKLADDPEAKYMARRLFLIAAYLDPQQFGPSALVSMSSLAGTPAEARKCRAMAFLLDPKGAADVLKRDAVKPAPMPKDKTSALQDFQKALQWYRTGQILNAWSFATKSKDMDKVCSMAPGMMDQKEFVQRCLDANCSTCNKSKLIPSGKVVCPMCNGFGGTKVFGGLQLCTTCKGQKILDCTACDGTGVNQTFPDDAMRIILQAELWAVDQMSGGDAGGKKGTGATTWSSILRARQVGPVSPLSLETITEFDPRKCLYRNGAWVVP